MTLKELVKQLNRENIDNNFQRVMNKQIKGDGKVRKERMSNENC